MSKTSRVPEHRRRNLRAAIDNTGAVSLDSLLADGDPPPSSSQSTNTGESNPQAGHQAPQTAEQMTDISPDAERHISQKDEISSPDATTDQQKDRLRKSTFYLAESDIEALRRYGFKHRKDKSAVVRTALRRFFADVDLSID